MAKYRKKPIIVEAQQWYFDVRIKGVTREIDNTREYPQERFFIDTLEGKMEVKPGDWIITGIKGEKYPCKPDIFKITYEKVEDGTNTHDI